MVVAGVAFEQGSERPALDEAGRHGFEQAFGPGLEGVEEVEEVEEVLELAAVQLTWAVAAGAPRKKAVLAGGVEEEPFEGTYEVTRMSRVSLPVQAPYVRGYEPKPSQDHDETQK